MAMAYGMMSLLALIATRILILVVDLEIFAHSVVAALTPQISCEAPVSSSRPFLGVDFTTSEYLQDESCFPPRK